MENGIAIASHANRPRVRVIFEFTVSKPKLTFYRAVQATDGGYRMEKRGAQAKNYKTFMWCGSEEGLYRHRDAVEWCRGKANVSPISKPAQAV